MMALTAGRVFLVICYLLQSCQFIRADVRALVFGEGKTGRATARLWVAVGMRLTPHAESPRGVAPRGAHRTVLDSLPSHGSWPSIESCRPPPQPVGSSCCQLAESIMTANGLPPSLHGSCPASSLLRGSPSLIDASVLAALQDCRLCLFPSHHRSSSQVPYRSPDEIRAACTPDTRMASKSVTAIPFSRKRGGPPVSMSSEDLFRCLISSSFALVSFTHT
jgi:hypothetical protein